MITITEQMGYSFLLLVLSICTIILVWVGFIRNYGVDYGTFTDLHHTLQIGTIIAIILMWVFVLSIPCTGFQMIQWDLTPLKCVGGV